MKGYEKLILAIVLLALIVCTGVNTYIHIKSGEVKNLLPKTQVEQPAETPVESPAEQLVEQLVEIPAV